VVRRILVHRVIVSLILAPCRARGSATAVRRILVTSPEFSHHDHRAVLVFARAKMCGHLPLVCFIKCHWRNHRLLSHGFPATKKWASFSRRLSFPLFPSHREISWASVKQAAFPLPLTQFYQWADVTRFMMTLGLVGIRTPFNPKKSWWVDRRSM